MNQSMEQGEGDHATPKRKCFLEMAPQKIGQLGTTGPVSEVIPLAWANLVNYFHDKDNSLTTYKV